jgi:hypothetical protein
MFCGVPKVMVVFVTVVVAENRIGAVNAGQIIRPRNAALLDQIVHPPPRLPLVTVAGSNQPFATTEAADLRFANFHAPRRQAGG